MKHVITTNTYCKEKFGEKLYKLTLSAATSCPNRQSGQGCIFCSEGGSGEFAAPGSLSVEEQITFAKEKIRGKYKGDKFIAYFQSFTGTYGDINRLRRIYLECARREDIRVVSIATRPDCLGKEVMEMLGEIARIKPLWVELGLQTENDATARLIRRGYEYAEYERAVDKLSALNVHVITHIILGLPGEDRQQMLRSVKAVRSEGVKLQLLHVLKNTPLEQMYRRGEFSVLTAEEYYDIVADCLEILPEGTVVHRMTGDGDKRILVAPEWSADKKKTLAGLRRALEARGFML